MKKLKIILVFCLLNLHNLGFSQTTEIHSVGGWVEVTPLGQNKYQVDIQMLLALSGALKSTGNNHIKRIYLDTSVDFKVIDSSGNKISIPAKFIGGYFFSQKDTSNQSISLKQVLWNNYYKNQFRCTLDLNSATVKSAINVNSKYLDFYCNFTSAPMFLYSMLETYNIDLPNESPAAHTRLYLSELTTNEKSLIFSNCAFSKFADYNSNTYQAVNYYNPGVYGKYGDSVFLELVKPETSVSTQYRKGFSATTPAYAYCPDSSNSCAAKPNSYPPQGFYFNSQTGDIIFTSTKPAQFVRFAIKAHHYRKNSTGQWRYLGYSILHHGMMTAKSIFLMDKSELTLFPRFILPSDIKLCEGDSVTSVIKTTVNEPLEKYTASVAGNFPNASVTTDYSTGNSTPTFRLKVVAKKGDNSSAPGIVTLRVHADSNWTRGEAARSVPVYVYKPINPEIAITTNGCNNLKAVFKGANTDVPVKLTWSLHEKSPSSPAIFTTTNDSFTYSELLPEKYFVKCYVIPKSASCKCTGKTVVDSLDMKSLWPGLDFQLNRNSVCLADSTKVYFPKSIQQFKSNLKYAWELNGKPVNPTKPDTLAVRLSAGSTIKLTLSDDSGCILSKSFILPVDTIYFLQQETFLERCNPDTLSLAAFSPYSNSFVQGGYTVINDANEVEFLAEESIFKYYYHRPKYQVLSTFTSKDGCVSNFTTDIFIDTTRIRFKSLPSLVCKGMKTLSLSSIGATPKGGSWSNSQGKDSTISLTNLGKYPNDIVIQYQIESSGCVKSLSDTLRVIDTLKNTLATAGPVCKESKIWDAAKELKFGTGGGTGSTGGDTTSGTWYSPLVGLNINSNGVVNPRKSAAGIYPVYRYSLSKEGCSVQHEGKVEILPAVLNLSANISALMGKPPLVVNFEGQNSIAGATSYHWIFGDTKQSPKDTAWGASVSYTYNDTGRYTPRLIGSVGSCKDTVVLATINVGLMSVESHTQSLRVQLFPNPTELGNTCTLWVNGPPKQRFIHIYNTVGTRISVHQLSANQDRLELMAPAPGLYFVEVEGTAKSIQWLVE